MKETKFTAEEIRDSFEREFTLEDKYEIYKGIIAYRLGIREITPEIDEKLEKVMDFYMDTKYISNIIDQEIIDYADRVLSGEDLEEDEEDE